MAVPLQYIADCMKGGISADASPDDIKAYLDACRYAAMELNVELFLDSGLNAGQAAGVIRSAVLQKIGEINEVLAIGLSRGYLLPDSPFPEIERVNSRRQIFQTYPGEYNYLIVRQNAAVELSKIAQAYKDGKITFPRKAAAQLDSYEVSVDGIAPQTGDPLADILGYQPDGDFIKRKRAIDSLAKLDFAKRKTYLLFTMDGNPDGIVVCWGKMRDASGYTISRRDVFNDEVLPDIVKSNASLVESTKELLKNDQFFQALSFYDWTGPQDVFAFLDDSVTSDTLYSYTITGMQKKAPASPFIFDVPMNALFFSPAMAEAAQAALENEAARFGKDPSTISPYPAIAQAVYDDPGLGWIIAGCNMLSAVRRGDSVDDVRASSFIGSTATKIFADAKAGRLFVPSSIATVQNSVDGAVAAYGISQTILSIMDGVGMTHFISGKDDPNGIQPTQASVEGSTSGLAKILSAIDPETATLDPKLITISSKVTSIKIKGMVRSVEVAQFQTGPSLEEILGDGVIDLTTYSGMGRLMQLLRLIYDFYPGAFT